MSSCSRSDAHPGQSDSIRLTSSSVTQLMHHWKPGERTARLPTTVLTGPARQRERLPCFKFGRDVSILPAFGEFTGCAEVIAEEGDEVWVVAGDDVLRIRTPRDA